MDRRRYLTTFAGIGAAATGGCLGANPGLLGGGSANVHLGEPDRRVDSSTVPYPAHGEPLPEVTLRDPLNGTDVTTTGFDDRDVLLTFFYSNCNTVCPVLVSTLRKLQTTAAESGYGDEVAFLAVTFDPERDDADRLREYGETMNVDLDAGNWHFLRPETERRAKEVVQETYGVAFERTGATDSTGYMFNHLGAIVLANRDNYVERTYVDKSPEAEPIREDLETLRKREG